MSKIYPKFEEFKKLAMMDYNVVSVVTEISADTETPISVFMKICGEKENSVLLESHLGGENFGRFSFICFNPFFTFYIKGNKVALIGKGGKTEIYNVDNPLDLLEVYLAPFRQAWIEGLPDFTGGLVGYIGHEMVKFCDDVKIVTKKESGYYDAMMMFARTVIAFDNQKNKIQIINNVTFRSLSELKDVYDTSVKENEEIVKKLQNAKIDHHYLPLEKSNNFKVPESNIPSQISPKMNLWRR